MECEHLRVRMCKRARTAKYELARLREQAPNPLGGPPRPVPGRGGAPRPPFALPCLEAVWRLSLLECGLGFNI